MKIIPGRFKRRFNVFRADNYKNAFIAGYRAILQKALTASYASTDICVSSFSSGANFYDQLLSILSFLKFVGRPPEWIVFSDGSYSVSQIEELERFDFLRVVLWSHFKHEVLQENDCDKIWQTKKFYCNSSLPIHSTSIYADSDILFFEGFNDKVRRSVKKHSWYLPELKAHVDEDYTFEGYDNLVNFANGGFFILNEHLDWSKGSQYISRKIRNHEKFSHFTEQTAVEIVFKHNDLRFLDPRLFFLNLDDHFTLHSSVDYDKLAIRHFVGPIRFRMYQAAARFNYFQ